MLKQDNKIGAEINLVKIPANNVFEFEFDQHTPWLNEILKELNENATEISSEELSKTTSIHLEGSLEKKNKPELGEFLTCSGVISATYSTECVRTLKSMTVDLEVPFKICFIDLSLEDSEMFKDTDETWVENDVYEIYFYSKRTIDLKEMVHEQVFLHYNQYPVLDAASPLKGVISEEEN